MFINMNLEYPILLIKANGKRSFKELGRLINKSGDAIKRRLSDANETFSYLTQLALNFFDNKKKLYFIIDDTLIKKIYSRYMQGSGRFYDTKIGKKILAYKLLCAAITDGKYILPLKAAFLFDRELLANQIPSKIDIVKNFIIYAKKMFPNITVLVDGAFASKDFLSWCMNQSIPTEVRMHSNRKVFYKGQYQVIREIADLVPKGRYMARTIKAIWHGIPLEITAQRRIDKRGAESIIYQAATFNAKPAQHVATYKKRWPIEKLFRTTKQHLGLQECFSLNLDVQINHVASVLLAYSLIQLDLKIRKTCNPEVSIRQLKLKKINSLKHHIARTNEIFGIVYA